MSQTGDKDYYTKLYEIHEYAVKIFQKQLFSDKGKKVIKIFNRSRTNRRNNKKFKIGLSSTWMGRFNK